MVYFQIDSKRETTNPDEVDIKDKLLLNSMTWSESENIEYNTTVTFQTRDSNTPGYYIV